MLSRITYSSLSRNSDLSLSLPDLFLFPKSFSSNAFMADFVSPVSNASLIVDRKSFLLSLNCPPTSTLKIVSKNFFAVLLKSNVGDFDGVDDALPCVPQCCQVKENGELYDM